MIITRNKEIFMYIQKKLFLAIMLVHLTPCLATVVPVEKSEVKESPKEFERSDIETLKTKCFSFAPWGDESRVYFENPQSTKLEETKESEMFLFNKINITILWTLFNLT
jgi:hypothetical protein